MKHSLLVALVLVFAYGLSACAKTVPAATPSSSPIPPETSATVEDQASFQDALQAEGATTETGNPITQDFFSVEGQTIQVNGTELQVFEYEEAVAMEKDAAQVAPDGGSIGTAMVTWMDPPHFYKAGRILVLYLGDDQATLDLLNKTMGPQFAGQ